MAQMRAFIRPDKRTERLLRNGTLNVRHLVRPKRRNIGLGTPVRRFGKLHLWRKCVLLSVPTSVPNGSWRTGTLNVRHSVRPKRRNIGLGTPVRRFGKLHLYYVCARSTGEYPFSVSRARRFSGLDAKQLTFTDLKCNIEDEDIPCLPDRGRRNNA